MPELISFFEGPDHVVEEIFQKRNAIKEENIQEEGPTGHLVFLDDRDTKEDLVGEQVDEESPPFDDERGIQEPMLDVHLEDGLTSADDNKGRSPFGQYALVMTHSCLTKFISININWQRRIGC